MVSIVTVIQDTGFHSDTSVCNDASVRSDVGVYNDASFSNDIRDASVCSDTVIPWSVCIKFVL